MFIVTTSLLSLHQVDVSVRDKMVLQNLNFEVNEGEFIGIIGPNGAGKTTLLKAILGLIPVQQGQLFFADEPMRRGNRKLAYVPQKINFEPDTPLRARDLVGLGLDGHKLGFPFPNRKRKEQIEDVMRAVNALHFADASVGRLSGGEQQRLMIAQALLSQPRLLLLDEPLANLDIKSANEVVQLLSKIGRERHLAIMLVAHDVNPLLDAMDQVIYVAQGRAIKGEPEFVIQSDVLSQLYGYDVDVLRVRGRVLVMAGKDGDGFSPVKEVSFS